MSERVLVDGRCGCAKCEGRTKGVYRMIGACTNCLVEALIIYRVGDKAGAKDCPHCGNYWSIKVIRAAEPDELPIDYEEVRQP